MLASTSGLIKTVWTRLLQDSCQPELRHPHRKISRLASMSLVTELVLRTIPGNGFKLKQESLANLSIRMVTFRLSFRPHLILQLWCMQILFRVLLLPPLNIPALTRQKVGILLLIHQTMKQVGKKNIANLDTKLWKFNFLYRKET